MQGPSDVIAAPVARDLPNQEQSVARERLRAPSPSAPDVRMATEHRGLVESLVPAEGFADHLTSPNPDRSFHAPLHFFETVMSYGRNTDPRATLLMLNGYLNANQQAVGIPFFERLLSTHGANMTDDVRAVYIAALAILRATHAERVPLHRRIPWVLKSFRILEEARHLTAGEDPVVRWAAGQIYAQVPFFFGKKKQAYEDLNWLAERPETEPVFGFYREVYRQLARLHENDGRKDLANDFWRRSGFDSYQPNAMLMGWFTATVDAGATMAPEPVLDEIIPGRVFALYGFGYSDIYFVVSDDGRELLAVDAGTQPHSLQAAHDYLLSHHPDLPPVSKVFITHSHWDHIGGHSYIRKVFPEAVFYGRDNYQAVVDRVDRHHSYSLFRGQDFDHRWVAAYAPDVPVGDRLELTAGGTTIELVPVTGGETEDALLVHFPGLATIFVGDIVMPWYGEPWVNEGFMDGAVDSIDAVLTRQPKHILHGHHPLTALYGPEQLAAFREHYVWLVDAVRKHINHGYSAKDIIRLNLVPPGLQDQPEAYLSFLAARDNVIARTADHMVGIWQEDRTGQDPQGLDALVSADFGRLLEHYLGLSADQAARAIRKMIRDGDNELALKFAIAAEQRFGRSVALTALKREAADRLRSAIQFFDPFRFVTYTEMIGQEHKPMPDPSTAN